MLENEREKNREDENWREKKKDKETKLKCSMCPLPFFPFWLPFSLSRALL